MDKRQAHAILNATKAGLLNASETTITAALIATGDLDPPRRTSQPLVPQDVPRPATADGLQGQRTPARVMTQ